MKEKKFNLEDRFVDFAADIVYICKELTSNYYGNKLLRSSGSSALNFGEAQRTNTVKDKIYKLTLTLKELKESRVNIRILDKVNYGNLEKRNSLFDGTEQLVKIIATIIKNKKSQTNP